MPNAVPLLKTKQLILREIVDADLEDYFGLCADGIVMRTWGTAPHSDRQQTLALIRLHRENFDLGRAVRWGIQLRAGGPLIGDIGFWRFVPERFRAEAGAKLHQRYWSSGFMTEALSAVVACGFSQLSLHTVEANIDPQNPGALRLVEKVGFQREGYLKEHAFCSFTQTFRDTALYSVIKSKWSPVTQ